MAILVRSFGVGIGCPSNVSTGQSGTVIGSIRCELENDADGEEILTWSIAIRDSAGNSSQESGTKVIPGRSRASLDETIFFNATYMDAGDKEAFCNGTAGSESDTRSCTFRVLP
jgi:hypothetical protein